MNLVHSGRKKPNNNLLQNTHRPIESYTALITRCSELLVEDKAQI